jgi:prevent-host-death family protein
MSVTVITSRDFNQDTGGAKRAAEHGPVYVTDRGRPAHVLLSFEEYERLLGARRVVDLLAEPAGVEDVELVVPTFGETARPAAFD